MAQTQYPPVSSSSSSYSTVPPTNASSVLVDGQLVTANSYSTTITGTGNPIYLYANGNNATVTLSGSTYTVNSGTNVVTGTISGATTIIVNALLPSTPPSGTYTMASFPGSTPIFQYGNPPAGNGSGTWIALPTLITGIGADNIGYISTNNGVSWSTVTLPTTATFTGLAYGAGLWVGTTGTPNFIYSSNGTSWTLSSFGTIPGFSASVSGSNISYNNGYFVVPCAYSSGTFRNIMPWSTNGTTWNYTVSGTGAGASMPVYGNGYWLSGSSLSSVFNYTTNPSTTQWQAGGIIGSTPNPANACYGNGVWVSLINGSSIGYYVASGVAPTGTWSSMSMPFSIAWYGAIYGNGYFVALANATNSAAYSTNGITWTSFSFPGSQGYITAGNGAYNNNTFLVTMTSGTAQLPYNYLLPVTFGVYNGPTTTH